MNPDKYLPPVILPTACLPNIEYFCWLFYSKESLVEIHETYPKQTCRNRYAIETASGGRHLSVPVIKPNGNYTLTKDVLLDPSPAWKRIHWRTLESAYSKSPFFQYYSQEFADIILNPPVLLIEFNMQLIRLICGLLKFEPTISMTESFEKETGHTDLRQFIMDKKNKKRQWNINYFDPYIQVFSDRYPFYPNLSIIDLLFNKGPDSASYLEKHRPATS
jgi:hypothetical protein